MLVSSATFARLTARSYYVPGKRALARCCFPLPGRPPDRLARSCRAAWAVTGHVATVFGCTGFLVRRDPIVAKVAKAGTQRHLNGPTGDLGQIVSLIAECVRHSDIVYNLVGRDMRPSINFTFDDVHVQGAERIAKVSASVGVPRLVHFYRSKAAGESAVRDAFPAATIVRPGPMFGHEDKFLTNMSTWPIWWKLNHGQTKSRPVHALSHLIGMPALERTLALPGPSTHTHEFLLELVSTLTYNAPSRAPVVPKRPDEVERRYIDDEDTPGDWALVGVEPDEIENHAITYVRRYRSAANYIRPIVVPPRPVSLASPLLLPLTIWLLLFNRP
ncbi:NAD(P)-binding protein [Lactarius sanguifluus]|nr:NAD(P)-binding protein [Lactarius sanguifluus]